jgi:hypothetical protein
MKPKSPRLIQQLLDEGACEDWDEADAHVCDPRNQLLCGVCGWSVGICGALRGEG